MNRPDEVMLAHHEAAHVVIARFVGMAVLSVTIAGDNVAEGRMVPDPDGPVVGAPPSDDGVGGPAVVPAPLVDRLATGCGGCGPRTGHRGARPTALLTRRR